MSDSSVEVVRLGAVTADLEWAYRRSCSHDLFDPLIAESYIRVHVDRSLRFMEHAASLGAKLVLGPEYFRGSELFTVDLGKMRSLTESLEGPTTMKMRELAKRRGIYLAAAFDAQHGDNLAQTGVLVGPAGELLGHHVKHGTSRPGKIAPAMEDWNTQVGRLAIAVCADAEKPRSMIDLAERGVKLLLLPGCGFAGRYWREFVIVRAMDMKCAVVYADENRAMIVSARGDVLAETQRPNDVIVADVPLPR